MYHDQKVSLENFVPSTFDRFHLIGFHHYSPFPFLLLNERDSDGSCFGDDFVDSGGISELEVAPIGNLLQCPR